MKEDAAEAYHVLQVDSFAAVGADMVTALSKTNTSEAIAIVRAALRAGIPAVPSFTLETDGRLPTGQTLAEAIETVDEATDNGAAYYMINCAHPTHRRRWTRTRVGGSASADCAPTPSVEATRS